VHILTHREDPDRIKKMWEEEEKAKKALYKTQLKKDGKKLMSQKDGDEEMKSDNDSENEDGKFVKHTAKKHQNMFNSRMNQIRYDNYYDEEDEDEYDEEEDEDDQH
jgi:hypothetical protein